MTPHRDTPITHLIPCENCGGSGIVPSYNPVTQIEETLKCRSCDGTGYREVVVNVNNLYVNSRK